MKKRKTKMKIDKIDIIMILIMVVLGIFIIFLGFKIAKLNASTKNKEASIVIPVIEEGTSYAFQVDLNNLKENEDYIFKVTNYKGSNLNTSKLSYTIKIGNETLSNFKLYKNDKEVNLNEENNVYNLQNNKLKTKTKQEDVYRLVVTEKNNVNKDSKLVINVVS